MGRASVKENKNIYFRCREELKLTREQASELLEAVTADRIEKIENERSLPQPDEVYIMSDKYKAPELCNFYCANQCPIGKHYVPEVKVEALSQIILGLVASLNSVEDKKDRLIEIAADGEIDREEFGDFQNIRKELERISLTVEALQLWTEKMEAEGKIGEQG
ncbi:MAG: XRE family transcriptional regulator [Lachnospiraceae bacterium]|nr:XRE family transcriptional regulator [Lachnospiraceae bacterium]